MAMPVYDGIIVILIKSPLQQLSSSYKSFVPPSQDGHHRQLERLICILHQLCRFHYLIFVYFCYDNLLGFTFFKFCVKLSTGISLHTDGTSLRQVTEGTDGHQSHQTQPKHIS